MNRKLIGILLMVLSSSMLALTVILMKIIPQYTQLSPGHVAVWRFSIAAPTLWMLTLIRHRQKIRIPEQPMKLLLLGSVYAVSNFTSLFALSRLNSSLYVIIIFIYPSLVVLYGLFTGKRVPKLYWLGLPLTFIGLVMVAYKFGTQLSIDPIGFVFTIVNALAMAVYFILSEKFLRTVPDKLVGTNWVLMGGMLAGLLAIPLVRIGFPGSVNGWILLVTLGIFGTVVPILAVNYALQLMGAARGSVIMILQPILTVIVSTILFDEVLTLWQWLGGILVIAAVVMLQLSPDKVRQKEILSQQEESTLAG